MDLAGGTITIREEKRVVGKRSTRTAPITPKLAEVMREWLDIRPDNPSLFCQGRAGEPEPDAA